MHIVGMSSATAGPSKDSDVGTQVQNPFPGFDISKPLWDQSTLGGRFRHFLWVTDPRTLPTSTKKLYEAKALVDGYR